MGLTKDRERRETRDQAKDVGVSADAKLSQRRDALIDQRKNVIAGAAAQEQALRDKHLGLAADAAKRSPMDVGKVAAFEDQQAKALKSERRADARELGRAAMSIQALREQHDQQRQRLAADANRGVPADAVDQARTAMDDNHARQVQRSAELVDKLREALSQRALASQISNRVDRHEIASVTRSPAADEARATQYEAARTDSERRQADTRRTEQAEIAHLQRELSAVRFQVDDQTLGRLRERLDSGLGKALDQDNVPTARLSDEAIQRVATVLLAERERSARLGEAQGREGAAIEHAKGQLFEEIVHALTDERLRLENQGRDITEQARAIRGDAIRNALGQKMGDELVVRPGNEAGSVKLPEAIEAKAGPKAAEELDERFAALSQRELDELMDQAMEDALDRRFELETGRKMQSRDAVTPDVMRERIRWEDNISADQVAQSLIEAQRDYEKLLSRDSQREAGQPESLRERLRAGADRATRFFENGQPRTIENDRGIRIRTAVPADVHDGMSHAQRNEALRIEIQSARLRELVEAMKKQLQHDRYW
jgi:hypothetical protein